MRRGKMIASLSLNINRFIDKDRIFYSSINLFKNKDLAIYLLSITGVFLLFYLFILRNYISYPLSILLLLSYPLILVAGYKGYMSSVKSSFSNALNHEKPIIYLMFSVLGKRFSLERIVYILLFSPSARFLDAARRLFRIWMLRFYLTGKPMDQIIFDTLDKIPDNDLRKYFKELIRVNWIGGDISTYLRDSLKKYYDSLKEIWTDAWKDITGYLEIIILIFGLFPSILASLIFLIGFETTVNLFMISLVTYPLISYVAYDIIERRNPNLPNKMSSNKDRRILILSILIFVIGIAILLMHSQIDIRHLTIISLIAISPSTLKNFHDILIETQVESDILVFLRELEELMKGGLSLLASIKQVDLSRYHRILREEIREIIIQYENGLDIREINLSCIRSLALLKLALSEIIYAGGGLEEIIELRDLIESYYKISKLRRKSAIIPIFTSIFVIFLGGYSMWVIKNILSGLNGTMLIFLPLYSQPLQVLTLYSQIFLFSGAIYTGTLIDKAVFGRLSSSIALSLLLASLSLLMISNLI